MLSLKPTDLMQEIRDAETRRDKHLACINEIIRRLAGLFWRNDNRQTPTPENLAYAYVTYVLPQVAFIDDPTTTYRPADEVGASDIADGQASAMDQWIIRNNAKQTLTDLGFDILVGFGFTMLTVEPRGDHDTGGMPFVNGDVEGIPLKPAWSRIHRSNVIIDAYAKEFREARLVGRKFTRDLDDLKTDPRYANAGAALDSAAPQMDDPLNQKREPFEQPPMPNDRRRQVTLYELYLPEYRKMITLMEGSSAGSDGTIIRDEDYFGPEDGPFQLWGDLFIPGEMYPISPCQAMMEQNIELNAQAVAASIEASTYKNLVIVNSNDPNLSKQLGGAVNGGVYTAQDVNGMVHFSLGGTSPERIQYVDYLRQRADRTVGTGDAQRGAAKADTTATADEIAKAAGDVRTGWHRGQLRNEFRKTCSKVDWYHWHSEAISYRMTQTNYDTGEKFSAVYIGGRWPGDQGYGPEDFQIDVDVHDDALNDPLKQKRAQDLLALMTATVPLIAQFPQFGWDKVIDIVGDSMRYKKLSRQILPMQIQQIADPMMQAAMGQLGPAAGLALQQGAPGGAPGPMQSAQPQVGGVQATSPRQLAGPVSAA
jgi:hypothetical protein